GYGVPGWVMSTKKPYICNDAENDPHVISEIRQSLCFYNFINVPILNRRGELLGCFEVLNKRGHRRFDEGEIEILRGLAASAAIALENAQMLVERKRSEEALQENLAQLSKKNRYENIISTVTRSVHRSINLQDVLENAVESMSRNIDGVDTVAIYMAEGEEAVLKTHRGFTDSYISRAGRIPYPRGLTWRTIVDGKARYCEDVELDTVIGAAGKEMGIKSYLSTPICFEGKTLGCINISSFRKKAFNKEELRLLETVGQQIEIAINNAKQMEALKKSEEQQALILRSVPMATYVCRTSDNFGPTWMSENVEHVAGFPSKRFVDEEQLWVSRIHRDDRQRVLTEFGTMLDKGSIAIEYRWQCADGSYHWFLDQAVLVGDEQGKPKEIIGTWLDITDRKQAEQEVLTLNLQLEERVNERTAQLKAANEELLTAMEEADRANRAKSEFLSRMSHELRTPMNAILGFAQLLEMYPSITPERRENVKHILEAGRHLLNLINEVLDITRIDSGRLTVSMEQVRVKDVTEEALDLIQPIAEQRKIRLQSILVNDWYILADRRRVKQVLLNLLSNAVKYDREGGLVDLSCEEVPEKLLRIKVSDTGSGIPLEKIERLFNPFDRLGAEQSSIEGTGLGLALCKQLVGAMRGIIGVESTAGQGSTFWLEMPLVETPAEQLNRVDVSSKVELEADGKGRTVLYIEDDLSSLRLIEQILVHRPGIKVLSAMQGSLGLDLAHENDPDLILLDLNLPDLSGEEVLCRLKEDPKTREIPVAIISANGVPGNVEKFLTLGVQAYLTKPLDVEEFLNALDNVL
ncbi:MAG: GAF domain-containing protein, partial [Thermodesulfobacteriota bacterium]